MYILKKNYLNRSGIQKQSGKISVLLRLSLYFLFLLFHLPSYAEDVNSSSSDFKYRSGTYSGISTTNSFVKSLGKNQLESKDEFSLSKSEIKYYPYFELGGVKYFNQNSSIAGIYDLFIPLLQTDDKLFFTDLRIFDRSGSSFEGNAHFGFRKLFLDRKQIIGIYGSFDRKRTDYRNWFSQVMIGAEYWQDKLFIGGNLYKPIGRTRKFTGKNEIRQTSRSISKIKHYEESLPGFDGEIGYAFTDNLTGYVGGYYFYKKDAEDAITGPKLRFTYFYNKQHGRILGVLDGVGIEIGAQHDEPRGTSAYIGIKLKVGLTGLDLDKNSNIFGFERHMTELVRRDPDIIIEKGEEIKPEFYQPGDYGFQGADGSRSKSGRDLEDFSKWSLEDLLKELGLPKDATLKEAKKKYYEYALKYHPDRNKNGSALFIRYTDIYETVKVKFVEKDKQIDGFKRKLQIIPPKTDFYQLDNQADYKLQPIVKIKKQLKTSNSLIKEIELRKIQENRLKIINTWFYFLPSLNFPAVVAEKITFQKRKIEEGSNLYYQHLYANIEKEVDEIFFLKDVNNTDICLPEDAFLATKLGECLLEEKPVINSKNQLISAYYWSNSVTAFVWDLSKEITGVAWDYTGGIITNSNIWQTNVGPYYQGKIWEKYNLGDILDHVSGAVVIAGGAYLAYKVVVMPLIFCLHKTGKKLGIISYNKKPPYDKPPDGRRKFSKKIDRSHVLQPFLHFPKRTKDIKTVTRGAPIRIQVNLDYEYEDQDINALLELRAQQEGLDLDRITLMPPLDVGSLEVQLEEENQRNLARSNRMGRWIRTTIRRTLGYQPYTRMVLIPLNIIEDHHWVGIVVFLDEYSRARRIYYIDSLGRAIPKDVRAVLRNIYGGDIVIEKLNILLQTDGTSCGPLTVENLIRIATNGLETENADEQTTRRIRNHHINLLEELRDDLNFHHRQLNNIRSFSYAIDGTGGKKKTIELTPLTHQKGISKKDQRYVEEIIKLCKIITTSYQNYPEKFISLANGGFFKVKLPYTVSSYPNESLSYIRLIEALNGIFTLSSKISWDVQNNPKYQNIPWRHLAFMKDVLIGNTRFPEESRGLSSQAIIDFITDEQRGLFALQMGLESLLASKKSPLQATLFRYLGGFYYDALVYEDILDRLGFLRTFDEERHKILEWKLALLRTMQVAGEHFKNLAWVSKKRRAMLPRKLLLDGRDTLSHVRIRQLSDFIDFLEEGIPGVIFEAVKNDIQDFFEGISFAMEEQQEPRSDSESDLSPSWWTWQKLWEKIISLDLDRRDDFKKWSGLESIMEKFKASSKTKQKKKTVDEKTTMFIETLLDELLPYPSHKRQTDAFFKHMEILRKKVSRNYLEDSKKFQERLRGDPIPLTGEVNYDELFEQRYLLHERRNEIRKLWNHFKIKKFAQLGLHKRHLKKLEAFLSGSPSFESFQDFLQQLGVEVFSDIDLMRYLYSIWHEIIASYQNYQSANTNLEGKLSYLRKKILQVKDVDVERYEKNSKKLKLLTKRRTELRNYLTKFSRRDIGSDYRVIQRQYEEFRDGIKRRIDRHLGEEDTYHRNAPSYLETTFSQLMQMPLEHKDSKLARRYNNVKLVNRLISLLRKIFGVKYTFDTEVEEGAGWSTYAKSSEGRKRMKSDILNASHQRFTPHFTQKEVEKILKKNPLKFYAAEYLISVICECIIKELLQYPEFEGRLSQLAIVRNFMSHPEGTYRSPLIMEDNTTYLRNPTATIAQQVAQMIINIQVIIEEVLKNMKKQIL